MRIKIKVRITIKIRNRIMSRSRTQVMFWIRIMIRAGNYFAGGEKESEDGCEHARVRKRIRKRKRRAMGR